MGILIVCGKPGFRRGGVAHPAKATYADGKFTAAQLKAFESEPLLTIVKVPDEPEGKAKGGKKE